MSASHASLDVIRMQIEELPAHLATIETELQDARRIELLRGETVIAELTKPSHVEGKDALERSKRPDFAARLKEMWGDKIFEDSTPLIRADRDAGY